MDCRGLPWTVVDCFGLSWTAVDCREGKILVNQVVFNKIDSILINNVQKLKNVFLLNEIHAYFCMYFSVTSQKMMVKIDKNAYLSLKTRKPLCFLFYQ